MGVDFTVPYMQTGITILFSQPSRGLRTFKSIEDLIKQDISFSCVEGGATERFFKNSKIPEYNQAWNMMNDFDLMTKNNNEGIERVLENPGEFAFLVESKRRLRHGQALRPIHRRRKHQHEELRHRRQAGVLISRNPEC